MKETILNIVGTAILTALLEYIVNLKKEQSLEKRRKYDVYREYYVLWDNIFRGRAFNFSNLSKKNQNKIINFLISKETYFDREINDLIYRLKTNYLDNFDHNSKNNIEECDKCFKKLNEILVDRGFKHRKNTINYHIETELLKYFLTYNRIIL